MKNEILVPLKSGEVISAGDVCRTILGEYVPAVASVGRKVHSAEVGYVFKRVRK